MSRWWVFLLVPTLTFASLTAMAYAYAEGNPLPWNGYGHTVLRVDSNFTVPANSHMTVRILGDGVIPANSFVWTMVYVLTRGSDGNPVTANFQFSYNGEDSVMIPGWGMQQDFQTKVDSQGGMNPQYVVKNVQPFDIVVLESAWVAVPPTTWDHFLMLLPWVLIGGSMLSLVIDAALAAAQRTRPRAPAA